MKNLYLLKQKLSFRVMLTAILMLMSSNLLFADGSKDLYPNGKSGYRAYLRCSLTPDTERWPFPTNGTHYVYAKAGERITLASSAQLATTSSAIRLFSPSGNMVVNDDTAAGQILNRDQEKSGPKLFGEVSTAKYTPIYYTVPSGGDGIYRVEFLARGTSDPNVTILADSNWTQGTTAGIFAWDISVINNSNTAFIPGRVYATLLNLTNGTSSPNTNGFRGIVYGLTDDGFTYRINNNGNNGLYFSFFINNNGFRDSQLKSIYKSLTVTNLSSTDVHNPTSADIISPTTQQITHKIFYTLPDPNLPQSSIGAVPGGSTWLKIVPIVPVVTQVSSQGVEGTQGQISSKGGYIKFNSNRPAKYTIIIKSSANPATFAQTVLTGFANQNANSILWDGKDGAGQPLPAGTHQAEISVQLQGAEVHFPYIDMEYNQNGTIIDLLNKNDLSQVESSMVYWNDVDIPNVSNGSNSLPKNNSHLPPINSTGINSNSNGHIWGVNGTGTGGQFGDQKSMDTWAFVKGPMETLPLAIVSRIADLKISQLTADKNYLVPGDVITFFVKAKNDGPSSVTGSKFTFVNPVGFTPQSVVFDGKGCGSESVAVSYNSSTRTYSSNLDLPNGCEIGYTVKFLVTTNLADGIQNFRAGILRTNDVTDPDATNPNPAEMPTDVQIECSNNGAGGTCNNIRNISFNYAAVAQCQGEVGSENFSLNGGSSKTFLQPATTSGFVLDIFSLDNSFNMNVNGVNIAASEIEFQSAGTPAPGINVRFADGSQYEVNTQLITNYSGNTASPLIRVVISYTGMVSLYGSKTAGGALFPLELFNGNTFNNIPWNTSSGNTIIINQNVVGTATNAVGRGYGLNSVACVCYNLPNTTSAGISAQHGITLLNRAGTANGNWPMIRKGAHTVLESNTKGFVITRMPTSGLSSITTPIDGMMVYDTTAKCLKIYTVDTVTPANTGWTCFSTPTCP
ncbi:hypothetical protein ASG31_10285 [Chryseobacterium sp. Leaf404]|uniref:DUF11 domain-containing protein n=1 Tax=Chryseobacterium sp. Leaf313 TaxID=2876563 RepID=UPI0006F9B2D7|nr:DUF11 domain-containing protein [Chryseobacterium sp. Leaf313]KQT16760.1 hypothetical protein ASG31_10285 [Chryseobacterium sp. Leaf404]